MDDKILPILDRKRRDRKDPAKKDRKERREGINRRDMPRPSIQGGRECVIITRNKGMPPFGYAKINVDGGISGSGTGAAAAVCRDHVGNFLGSSALLLPGVSDPATLKAIACCEARALADDLSLQKFVVACDCKIIVDNNKEGTRGAHITIIREIAGRRINFESCSFVFEGRASNHEAHNLAKFSHSLDPGRHLWLISPHDPVCIPLNIHVDQ